jgi:pSer/pThr/pTyr-binding forkhead associated (FHA) protein
MITCERCGTQNLAGSRYCDECGAALWLAGRSGDHAKPQANGNEGKAPAYRAPEPQPSSNKEISLTVARPANPPASGIVSQPRAGAVAVAGENATLTIERGKSAGKQFSLGPGGSDIGRWDADGGVFPDVDLDTDDPEAKVSRRHARISCENGQYVIEDLGSTNGTFVNRGRRLKPGERQPVNDGDEIIVGKTFLRFHLAK